MRTSGLPPEIVVRRLDRIVARLVTRRSSRRLSLVALVAFVLAGAACTESPTPTEPTAPALTAVPPEVTNTTVLPPPEIDLGVDLEAGVLRLAVVGDIPDDLWAGHLAYWDSVNNDLGGVGGRFEVELVGVDSIREAMAAGSLAVSLDLGDDPDTVLEILVATQAGSAAAGRLGNLTAGESDEQLVAGLRGLPRLSLEAIPPQSLLVTHPDRECGDAGEAANLSAPLGAIPEHGRPLVYLLCVPGDVVLSSAAEALGANPGSVLVVPGAAWSPRLAEQLEGSVVVVAGFLPEPGVDDAPGADLMGLVLGEGPWSGDLIDGYTRALSMHVVIERALTAGDLTRLGVRAIAGEIGAAAIGFGSGRIPIGRSEIASPTGVRFVVWAPDPAAGA